MKNLIISTGILVLVSTIGLPSFAQGQGKGNQKKEQDQGKGNPKANQGKGNANNNKDKGQGQGQGQAQGQGKGQGQDKDKDNQGNVKRDLGKKDYGEGKEIIFGQGRVKDYEWNRESFRDRKKIKNQGKVTLCHKFNRTDELPVTITVSTNALQAHLNHGDVQGECPATIAADRNITFSDIFLGTRRNYYNTLYQTQDQVIYSQSILDYALQRLTGARAQLVTLQTTNAPAYEVQRKQAVIIELEENASLLENLIGVTAGLLVGKLL